jgi:acyl-CoA reductase-like NAD-dependent aldehyde dehydrogenase
VLLAHPNIAIAVAELTRNFVIEKAQLVKNNNGRVSKQMKLYDYITGSARFRKTREKIEKRLNLDELQRKEEAYAKRTWNDRKKLIQDWYDLDREDQDNLNAITQEEGQIKEQEKEDISGKGIDGD